VYLGIPNTLEKVTNYTRKQGTGEHIENKLIKWLEGKSLYVI
jgi:hypothetical protein